ncbi:hypothetical protein J6590_071508 [Homalodisca vitripennis]|nr:hypothetical protein J6590_071508 [Homalodisca vitripennis]
MNRWSHQLGRQPLAEVKRNKEVGRQTGTLGYSMHALQSDLRINTHTLPHARRTLLSVRCLFTGEYINLLTPNLAAAAPRPSRLVCGGPSASSARNTWAKCQCRRRPRVCYSGRGSHSSFANLNPLPALESVIE